MSIPARLLQELGHAELRIRERAARAILMAGPGAIPQLSEELRRASVRTRWRIPELLVRIGDPAVIPALCGALEDGHALVRQKAADALVALGQSAALIAIARSGSTEARRRAVMSLHAFRADPDVVRALCDAVADRDGVVRCRAAEVLVALAADAPTPGLRAALPALERRAGAWFVGRDERRLLRLTAARIQHATEHLGDLPLPGSAHAAHGAELPRPAVPPRIDGAGLPRPGEVPGSAEP